MRSRRTFCLVSAALTSLALVSFPAATSLAAPTPAPVIPVIDAPGRAGATRTDTIIVTFERGSGDPAKAATEAVEAAAHGIADADITKVTPISSGMVAVTLDTRLTSAQQERLGSAVEDVAGVKAAEPNLTYHVTATGDPTGETYWDYQWNLGSRWGIKAPQAWPRSTGVGAVVGIVDTEITPHPDLTGSSSAIVGGTVVAGYDFITTAASAQDGDGRDADPTDLVADDYFHGTHVAGIVGARLDGDGIVGTAPGVRIQPLRALGSGGGSDSDIMAAMRWGAGLPVPGTPRNATPVDVLNLSLGGEGACPVAMQDTVTAIIAKGVVVVVSAGNSGEAIVNSAPANCTGVIRVTATGATGMLADYSNFGTVATPATIAAPGGSRIPNPANGRTGAIVSTWHEGTAREGCPAYAGMSGTSMAAPHVAGVAALLKSVKKSLTPTQITSVLQRTASALASTCIVSTCGAGIVDAAAAVRAAVPAPVPPTLTVTKGPAIRGTPVVARTLSGTAGRWSKKATLKRGWLRDGQLIGGATATRYRTRPVDVGHVLTFRVIAARAGYVPTTAISTPVRIRPGTLTVRRAPGITGKRSAGHALSGRVGKWRPKPKLGRQWLRDGQVVIGATRATWKLTAADRGHRLQLRVTATRAGYTTAIVTSAPVLIP